MRPPSAAAYATFAIAWSATALGSACVHRNAPAAEALAAIVCPTIPAGTQDAFVVHGARVLDGDRLLDPADVLVANGQVLAVGDDICFRAVGGTVSYVDGAGATLLAAVYDEPSRQLSKRGRITPGVRADLVLIADNASEDEVAPAEIRAAWRRGVSVE
jgi:predicted amidohydrolase YtcJ